MALIRAPLQGGGSCMAVWVAGDLVEWNPPEGYPGEPGCTCWQEVTEISFGGYVRWPHRPWSTPPVTRWEPRLDPQCRTHRE